MNGAVRLMGDGSIVLDFGHGLPTVRMDRPTAKALGVRLIDFADTTIIDPDATGDGAAEGA